MSLVPNHALNFVLSTPLVTSSGSSSRFLNASRCNVTGRPRVPLFRNTPATSSTTSTLRRAVICASDAPSSGSFDSSSSGPFDSSSPKDNNISNSDTTSNSEANNNDNNQNSNSGDSTTSMSSRNVTDSSEAAQKQPPHDIPQSSIDWNQSWADFQATGGKSMAPKGREPVTKEQLARQRAANRVKNISNSLPSRQQLFADWRFWVAIILTLSLFSAFVTSSATQPGAIGTI